MSTDQILCDMILYFGGDVRRAAHSLKVFGFARAIAAGEALSPTQRDVLFAAAALHDIGIHEAERKHGSAGGRFQELEGPSVAEEILRRENCGPAFCERVCFLVGHHHTYGAIDGPDFQILAEADFLVNIQEDGLARPQIETIRRNYFKTAAGSRILDSLYLK